MHHLGVPLANRGLLGMDVVGNASDYAFYSSNIPKKQTPTSHLEDIWDANIVCDAFCGPTPNGKRKFVFLCI